MTSTSDDTSRGQVSPRETVGRRGDARDIASMTGHGTSRVLRGIPGAAQAVPSVRDVRRPEAHDRSKWATVALEDATKTVRTGRTLSRTRRTSSGRISPDRNRDVRHRRRGEHRRRRDENRQDAPLGTGDATSGTESTTSIARARRTPAGGVFPDRRRGGRRRRRDRQGATKTSRSPARGLQRIVTPEARGAA